MRHRIEYAGFRIIRRIVLILPLKSAQRLGYQIGTLAYLLMKRRRKIALDNLHQAFPERSASELSKIALGSFRNYAIALVELLWFPNLTEEVIRSLVKPMNLELMQAGFNQGKGMVMLSGHFGNWELIALAMAYLSGHPFTIIVQTQSNAAVDELINRHRCMFGNIVVPMGMAVREIIRTLNRGGVVAIAPDQSGPMEGVFIEFFGRRVATHQGPATFTLRAGAVMQIGFIVRQADGTYEVVLEEIPTDDLHDASEKSVRELTQRHTAVLERYIRRYPDHWLWMHRRWKHTWESVERARQNSIGVGA